VGDYGYEIYAIGDSTDMSNNLDFYAGIIGTLAFSPPVEAINVSRLARRVPGTAIDHWYDAMGRIRPSRRLPESQRSALVPGFRKPGS
jgi:hypothetical protein